VTFTSIAWGRRAVLGPGILLLAILPGNAAIGARVDPATLSTAAIASTLPAPEIVIGFLGGFVSHDDSHHATVRLAQRLRERYPEGVNISTFENRNRKAALQRVFRLLDINHDGLLSEDEKKNARIILFGHSWGASAAVALARDLQRVHIPVRLTVQVDSVAKIGQNDSIIPANVADAVNFYQPHGIVHGRAQVSAADPSRTHILGNYRFDYEKAPIPCPDVTWYGRLLTRPHAESECDPRIWTQVEDLIRQHLSAAADVGPLAQQKSQ
jgi:pimeloyl-ACP methyl ester carboxylesterase